MANDLGTIGILVDVRGMPLVKELATTLNQTAAANDRVSNSAKQVIANLRQGRAAMRDMAAANTLAGASFSRLHLNTVAKNIDNLTSSTLRYNRAAQQSMQGANRFGMVSQQVGYQVGDFFVQVQSGTNALTAFGQQATQLAGLLPGLAGAIVGIGISLGTALGMAALRSQELTINFQKIGQDVLSALAPVQGLINAIGVGLSYAGQAAAKGMEVLVQNLDRIFIYGTTIAALFAGKYVAGMVAAAAATASLSSALIFLRGALIKTGIGALVVVAGELVYQFTRLVEGAGGFGKAVGLLWNVVSEFGSKVVSLFNSLKSTFEAAANFLSARFIQAINNVLGAFIEMTYTVADGLNSLFNTNVFQGADATITQQLAQISIAYEDSAVAAANAADAYYESATAPFESVKKLNEAVQSTTDSTVDLSSWLTKTEESGGKAAKGLEEATKAAEELRRELEAPLVSAVGSISDAFGDFVARGLTDFKGFVKSILGSFQNMIAQMISMAVKNRIMLSLGIGGLTPGMAAAGQIAGIGNAGGMLGSFAGGGVAGSGLLGGFGAAMPSFLGGAGNGLFAVGANAAAAGGTVAATIGAVAAPLLAVAAVFSFFKKKTKELDSGLRITVNNMDALVETFRTVQTTQFFGLSKKVKTTVEAASAEVSDPIVKAVQDIQGQVLKAAGVFGIAESKFADFLYNFEVSLKGLTEEQKIQKVNEELVKMGDSFAALSGHFSTMNELLEAANQRMELQNRLDTLLGNNQAVLLRQREAEIAATHELNRPLLTAIYNLEDAQSAVDNAFAALRSAIDKTVEDLQKKLSVANEAVNRSRGIFQQLENALSGRVLRGSDSQFSMRRQSALGFLRRGDFSDERQLEEALGVVSEPTEDLYQSFEEYARDFYYTTSVIEAAKLVAETQLTADEKQVALLEKQITDAQNQYDLMMQQYNAMMGVDTSVKSVETAVRDVQNAISQLGAAIAASQASALAEVGAGGSATGVAVGDPNAPPPGRTTIERLPGGGAIVRFAGGGSHAVAGGGPIDDVYKYLGKQYKLPGFAMGGMHSGGLRIVGENGPELEATGPSRIYNNRDTANMFRDPELANSVTELKNEVSRMRSEQLQIQLEISKNTKRIYDTERKWDVEGLPPERV